MTHRGPHTLTETKMALAQVNPKELLPVTEGYKYRVLQRDDAGVPQRWLVMCSKAANLQAQHQVSKELAKNSEADVKALTKLTNKAFACRNDAERALAALTKKLKVCKLVSSKIRKVPHGRRRGRLAKNAKPVGLSYHFSKTHCQMVVPVACRHLSAGGQQPRAACPQLQGPSSATLYATGAQI